MLDNASQAISATANLLNTTVSNLTNNADLNDWAGEVAANLGESSSVPTAVLVGGAVALGLAAAGTAKYLANANWQNNNSGDATPRVQALDVDTLTHDEISELATDSSRAPTPSPSLSSEEGSVSADTSAAQQPNQSPAEFVSQVTEKLSQAASDPNNTKPAPSLKTLARAALTLNNQGKKPSTLDSINGPRRAMAQLLESKQAQGLNARNESAQIRDEITTNRETELAQNQEKVAAQRGHR